jgi:arylsulfatase A-like enzyme
MEKLNRRDFLGLMAAGTAATIFSGHTGDTSPMNTSKSKTPVNPGSPNILFLFTDDQRFDTIHALGNDHIVTPNMDSLVQNGVTFTHGCIMGSMVGAVCMPSRAMLMSGRTLFRAPDDLADTLIFPEMLHEEGYTTYGVGKWHNQPASFARGFNCGAKIFFGGMSNHLEVPVNDFDPAGKYPKEKRYIGEKFSSELFSDAAVKFLREYEDDKPFLAYISYTAPHDPRMPPKKYKEMYDPKNIPVPENFMPEHPFDNGEMRIRDEKLAPWPRTPEIIQQHIADYYGMITHLDDEIGRILETLEETGHADNTIIIFAGDNGLAVGQHGLMGKQNLYDHSIRVPLIFTGPGIPKDRKSDALCYLLDIFPTICELIGSPIPETVEGQNLMPIIKGERQKLRDNLFFAYKDIQRAVRDDRYKLIEYSVEGVRTTQLFDLTDDPWEISDLSADPNYSSHLARLREEMARWQKEVDDPMIGE